MSDDWQVEVDPRRWFPVPRGNDRDEEVVRRWTEEAAVRLAGLPGSPDLDPSRLLESAPAEGGVLFLPSHGGRPAVATLTLSRGDDVARRVPRWTTSRGAQMVDISAGEHPVLASLVKVTRAVRMTGSALAFTTGVLAWGEEGGIELSCTTRELGVALDFAEWGEVLVAGITPRTAGACQPTNL